MKDPVKTPIPKDIKGTIKDENRLYKTALDHEMEALAERTREIGTLAAVAGGALIGVFLMVKLFKRKKKSPNDGKDKVFLREGTQGQKIIVQKTVRENPFLAKFQEQIALLIVAVIKEKISGYTEMQKKKIEQKKDEVAKK